VKGVFTEISSISEVLKRTAQECEQNAISISLMTVGDDISTKKLDQLDSSFMYTQLLKEIILTINFEEIHIKEFIEYCSEQFAENDHQLQKVIEFKRKYHDKTPIYWYTSESFLYPMLNRVLRIMDVDMIIKLGFFTSDLHRHIKQLHKDQFSGPKIGDKFTVYRGQGMLKKDVEHMKRIKGGLLSFNCFLSTSRDREVSLMFAESNRDNPNLVGILFVMTIDPSQSTTPFASITDVSHYGGQEDEVLFSMHSVFRIRDIKSIGENDRLYQVDLTLTNDNDRDLRALTDRMEEELKGSTGWDRLGSLLIKMKQSEKAKQVYEILLQQTTDQRERATFYNHLGLAKYNQGEYKEALALYEKSLAIKQQSLPPNHPDLASSYGNIGLVYDNMGDYSKALSSYEKTLAIQQQSLPPNHPDLASSYMNIGNVYYNMGDYSKALSSYEKSLAIQQQSLPPNHPDLASSYMGIGLVYDSMGDYPKALSSHEKSLAIKQQSLPPNHPNLAASYNNIGVVYKNMRDYSKALSYYEKSLAIQQQSLPPNHPDLASSYMGIGNLYYSMGDYSKALSSLEKSLAIKQQSLPPKHPDLANSYNNIGVLYQNMRDYSKARSFYTRAVEIAQQSLPPTHPHLQMYSRNLDRVKNL
jgi:tetratricopeptide (TPR) repeat protein